MRTLGSGASDHPVLYDMLKQRTVTSTPSRIRIDSETYRRLMH
jgi:hypothetical protein